MLTPDSQHSHQSVTAPILLIACGAIARELIELQNHDQWSCFKIQCLPANLHNSPGRIPEMVRELIEKNTAQFEHIFVAYADCGTGGRLDEVLDQYNIDRLPGAHCYEFYSSSEIFKKFSSEEPGTFFLTDFLVRNFNRLIKQGLGLIDHPELLSQYFGNYKRVMYLSQDQSQNLSSLAHEHALYLGLEFCEFHTGLVPLRDAISEQTLRWRP
ncbi:MAG: DUF1638 domain-containing protein [Pseudomonadales bacterium]|jgi:hypothetical protein|nr:hypothetical protein [Gammaproteobacteria bacterium]MDP6026555.1 DUF1638 domain-containing protein [Pseudomonadales bacterium]MDP6317143.1 DUF1638 domain-containing protein [Pseudomonadales bacterium]MDP7314067.1 DUF1638 domain-containing protein [Pseudomonadales bacterium]MDP7576216.1 DUF1638 domain-containing protein [Pseudomonadales bacterium]|tara:strand:- start:1150 stop:1788 length:639 start_codon:yes stop_codon:yes gene_type:complete